MASYEYRVIMSVGAAETIVHAPATVVHAEDERGVLQSVVTHRWTHETATAWCRIAGQGLIDGTVLAIDRRRGGAMYMPHRRYTVGADGMVRRTDR